MACKLVNTPPDKPERNDRAAIFAELEHMRYQLPSVATFMQMVVETADEWTISTDEIHIPGELPALVSTIKWKFHWYGKYSKDDPYTTRVRDIEEEKYQWGGWVPHEFSITIQHVRMNI